MSDALEKRLLAGYRQQLQAYEQALNVVCTRADNLDWLAQLQQSMQQVAALDQQLATDKADWRLSGRAPGSELRTLLDQLATKIATLKDTIDSEVAELHARRSRLLPEIDDFIRQRWMLNAYGQATTKV